MASSVGTFHWGWNRCCRCRCTLGVLGLELFSLNGLARIGLLPRALWFGARLLLLMLHFHSTWSRPDKSHLSSCSQCGAVPSEELHEKVVPARSEACRLLRRPGLGHRAGAREERRDIISHLPHCRVCHTVSGESAVFAAQWDDACEARLRRARKCTRMGDVLWGGRRDPRAGCAWGGMPC